MTRKIKIVSVLTSLTISLLFYLGVVPTPALALYKVDGTVKSIKGTPMANVWVYTYRILPGGGIDQKQWIATDANGYFLFNRMYCGETMVLKLVTGNGSTTQLDATNFYYYTATTYDYISGTTRGPTPYGYCEWPAHTISNQPVINGSCKFTVTIPPARLSVIKKEIDDPDSCCTGIDPGAGLRNLPIAARAYVSGPGIPPANYSLNASFADLELGESGALYTVTAQNLNTKQYISDRFIYCFVNPNDQWDSICYDTKTHTTIPPAFVPPGGAKNVYIVFIKRQPVYVKVFEKSSSSCTPTGATNVTNQMAEAGLNFQCNNLSASHLAGEQRFRCNNDDGSFYFNPNDEISLSFNSIPSPFAFRCWYPGGFPTVRVPTTNQPGEKSLIITQTSPAWWQTKYGDIFTGNLVDTIPESCLAPDCYPYTSLEGAKNIPANSNSAGVITATHGSSFGNGSASDTTTAGYGWLTNSNYNHNLSYTRFEQRVIDKIEDLPTQPDSTIDVREIKAHLADTGTTFLRYRGDLTINSGDLDIGNRKLVLFVDGTLTLKASVHFNDGAGFAGFIVSHHLIIDSGLDVAPPEPALEGIYFAQRTVRTDGYGATPDTQIYIRGSLVGLNAIHLNRDLDPERATAANTTTPAETVIFAPDLYFTFPQELKYHGLLWEQIAD